MLVWHKGADNPKVVSALLHPGMMAATHVSEFTLLRELRSLKRAECDRLRAENGALKQRLQAVLSEQKRRRTAATGSAGPCGSAPPCEDVDWVVEASTSEARGLRLFARRRNELRAANGDFADHRLLHSVKARNASAAECIMSLARRAMTRRWRVGLCGCRRPELFVLLDAADGGPTTGMPADQREGEADPGSLRPREMSCFWTWGSHPDCEGVARSVPGLLDMAWEEHLELRPADL